ncbi:cobalt-precorrin 5A hydrolase [Acetivibrio cellulolyticus]|uniref:cobalt-precorrin 5A hydrolase n=1 Tax=Acetivibrio cellulolyticus TaxID=35830 RepID=UPI0001E2CC07|nr:cobalt-precorrin 5A hydrolase [Acetivibrio cellulolyticus]
MKITLVAFTKKGANICLKLTNCLREKGHQTTGFSKCNCHDLNLLENNLYDFTKKAFETSSAIVFVGAIGIAVRAIAPFIISKAQDPAVIVVDELGEHVIPILSGHLGGANELAIDLAELLEGKAVITTATDINNVFSVDIWAKKHDLHIDNIENIKHISSAILNGQKMGFYCDFPVDGGLPIFLTNENADAGIYIYNSTGSKRNTLPFQNTLFMRPRQFIVGIGCRKGTEKGILEEVFLETLSKLSILPCLVKSVATIDIKKEENAITYLCEKYRYELKVYNSEELSKVKGDFTASEFVRSVTGVDNVCERAAYLASDAGEFVLRKTVERGITIAVAVKSWRCSF